MKKGKLWVAVVCKGTEVLTSRRQDGDCKAQIPVEAIISNDKDKAIAQALSHAREWSGKGYGEYQVLVGELKHEASYKTEYELEVI